MILDGHFRQHRAELHAGMDFVAGTVEKSGIDKYHPLPRRADRLLEIDGQTPLFVHDAKLEGVLCQPERLLDSFE